MHISSSAFAANAPIPSQFTCQGADRSPPLSFAEIPTGHILAHAEWVGTYQKK